MIRLACEKDIPAVADTYRSLLTYEKVNGKSSNWELDVYPMIRVPEEKIPLKQMYVLEEKGEICASMVLNHDQAEEYNDIPWLYPAEEALVVHTLCVSPEKAGHGYGTEMVHYAQRFAVENEDRVIRLDTYAHNEPAKSLYIRNGFRIAGYGEILLQDLIQEDQVYLEYKVGEDK